MLKGQMQRNESNHLSIAFIPHSSGNVKVIKITAVRSKLIALFLMLATIIVCAGVLLSYTIRENFALKEKVNKLYITNLEQNQLIASRASEIENLKDIESSNSKLIKDYISKYRELVEKYFSGRIENGTASRSGDRTEMDFAADIKELKSALDDFAKINNPGDATYVDLSKTEEQLKKYMLTIPTLWPASGRISDKFGYRKDPFTKRNTFHDGLDIGADYGASIKAAADGKVTFSGLKNGYGRMVVIDHGRGISTAYGHASKLLVKAGQEVKKGDIIAKVGSSGRSTGPHLHFEVRLYNTPVDPLKYLEN